MAAAKPPPVANDRGETLLELIVAVTIMGIAVVAIIGAIATAVMVSDIHRKQATAGTAVRAYAEAIQNALANDGYAPCGTAASYDSPSGFSVPSGYAKSAGSMRYWSGSSWQTSCATDTGLQQLTVRVASDDGRANELLVIVLRKPCRLSDPLCG